jgi:hypothetical protein
VIVQNRLTQPGGIKRVILHPDTIEVVMVGGEVRNYRVVAGTQRKPFVEAQCKEANCDGDVQMQPL